MGERYMFSPAQCRAARGLLGWTLYKTADAAGLHYIDFNLFECEFTEISPMAAQKLRAAFWQAGAQPILQSAVGPGVRYLSHHPESAIVAAARANPAAGNAMFNFPRPLFRAALGLLRFNVVRVARLARLAPERVRAFAYDSAVLTHYEMASLGRGVVKAGVIATVRNEPGVRLASLVPPLQPLQPLQPLAMVEEGEEEDDGPADGGDEARGQGDGPHLAPRSGLRFGQ